MDSVISIMAAANSGIPLGGEPVAAVVGGIVVLALCAIALVLRRRHLKTEGRMPGIAWIFVGALGGAALYLIGLGVLGRGAELATPALLIESVPWALMLMMASGSVVGYLTGGRTGWHPAGVGVFGAMALACIGWAAYLATVRLPVVFGSPTMIAVALFVFFMAQLIALSMVVTVTVYMLDGIVRREWRRDTTEVPYDPEYQPKVAIHVACYNEPPEVVAKTLDSLVAQDYPSERLHIMLLDDSTVPEDVAALERICEARGVAFIHREHRDGYKAGALNHALTMTPEDVTLIAVVDADFVTEPGFIKESVGYFIDPHLAFAQTRLDYSNPEDSFTARSATLMEHFFYTSMMRTRNEGNGNMFSGTMGILRRSAITQVGGWTDGHVGEDVDLACRILLKGWTSLYIPKIYGRGLQTIDQETFRRQHSRWAYGGARILRDHGGAILRSKMTARQKIHHLYAAVWWLDGTLALLFAATMFVFGLSFLTGSMEWLPARDLIFVGLIPTLIILENMLRGGWTLRWHLGISLKLAFSMIILGWSNKIKNAFLAWAAIRGAPKPFDRTPKVTGKGLSRRAAVLQGLRVAPLESSIALMLFGLAVAMALKVLLVGSPLIHPVLIGGAITMTLMWTVYFASSPICVYLGHVTRRPVGSDIPAVVSPQPVRA